MVLAYANPKNVVINLALPGMRALEALCIHHGSVDTAHISVIALIAAASEPERQPGERFGSYRCMTKPGGVAALEATLEVMLTEPTELMVGRR